jgi:GntR family transcriptional repressor for pyruvate dehydrogenase complex
MFTRIPVPQGVARKLQTMILDGELKTGQKIPSQRELSEKFGVSRASLREALMTLETIGLVKTEAGRGTFVVGTSPESAKTMAEWRYSHTYSLREVFETRLMLEGEIAARAAGRLVADDLEALSRLTDDMERSWAARDYLANVEADLKFHAIIARACGNKMLSELYGQVRDQVTETQRQPIPITDPKRMEASVSEHRRLIAALAKGDARGARRAMSEHVANTAACAGYDISAAGIEPQGD